MKRNISGPACENDFSPGMQCAESCPHSSEDAVGYIDWRSGAARHQLFSVILPSLPIYQSI